MKLVLVRHAIAEERATFAETGASDDERPLTKDGRKRMKRAARGIRELVDDPDMIVSSPLVRAVQTAEVIAAQYDNTQPAQLQLLAPESNFDEFIAWLKRMDEMQTLVAVGHEPHMSALAAWLLTGNGQPLFEMKKGSAVLLEFSGEIHQGAAKMLWLLTPAQLRIIGDNH